MTRSIALCAVLLVMGLPGMSSPQDGGAALPPTNAVVQAATGASAGKESITVNVRDYGASPSNPDNTLAIRKAVAFVNTQPAASIRLVFPPGRYFVDPLGDRKVNRVAAITADAVTVSGEGATIALAPGGPLGPRWGVASGSTYYWNYLVLAGSHDTVEGLTFDSNGMTSWSPGCRGDSGCWWATAVNIRKLGDKPIPTGDSVIHNRFLREYGWAVLSAGNNTRIEGNYATNSAGMVCQQLVPAGESTGCVISDNISVDSIDAPYAVNGGPGEGSAVTNFRIENNFAAGNVNGSGIDVTAAKDGVVTGNVITGMKNWCIQVDRSGGTYRPQPAAYIGAQRVQISGNVCTLNNQYTGWPLNAEIMIGDNYASAATGPEYKAGDTVSAVTVTDNMIHPGNPLGMAVAVGYGAADVTVSGNTISGCGSEEATRCHADRVFRFYDVAATAKIAITNNHQDAAYRGVLRTNGPGPYEIWGNNMGWDAFSGRPTKAAVQVHGAEMAAPAVHTAGVSVGTNPSAGAAPVRSCGGDPSCANGLQPNVRVSWGTVALAGGNATVSGLEGYTSDETITCAGADTTRTEAVSVIPVSSSRVRIIGSGSDTISWECHGT